MVKNKMYCYKFYLSILLFNLNYNCLYIKYFRGLILIKLSKRLNLK